MYQLRDTNMMVEEMMLMANITVATHIHKSFPSCAVLRRHETPSVEMFRPLLLVLARRLRMSCNKKGSQKGTPPRGQSTKDPPPVKTLHSAVVVTCRTELHTVLGNMYRCTHCPSNV